MFAMLNGAWPQTSAGASDAVATEARVRDAVRAQEAAGLELVTDGQVRWAAPSEALDRALATGDTGAEGLLVRAWRATAALADHPVAQVMMGPYSFGRHDVGLSSGDRAAATLARADRLAGELRALADAGCTVVVVEEPAAIELGVDDVERALFMEAHGRLLARAPDVHAMLAISGGSAHKAGPAVIGAAPYRSFLFDLVAGPDNWSLVQGLPGDRGIVCAAFDPGSTADPAPLLVWAARYAASAGGRGLDRVGLANAGSLADLTPAAAVEALAALGRAARLAALPPGDAIAAGLEPLTFAHSHAAPVHRGPVGRGVAPPARRTHP